MQRSRIDEIFPHTSITPLWHKTCTLGQGFSQYGWPPPVYCQQLNKISCIPFSHTNKICWYYNQATAQTIQGTTPSRGETFFISLSHSDWLWGGPAFYSTGTGNTFPGGKVAREWNWPLLHLVQRLQMSGAIPLLPLYTFMVCMWGKFYIFAILTYR
jgi:hypothetical protein